MVLGHIPHDERCKCREQPPKQQPKSK